VGTALHHPRQRSLWEADLSARAVPKLSLWLGSESRY